MGMACGPEDDTYPRLASPLGWVTPDRVLDTVEAVVTTQRDHGNRDDRHRARLKYLVDERGIEWMRAEVERRLGAPIGDPVTIAPWTVDDHHGTRDGVVGVPVPSGTSRDHDGVQLRRALRELVGDGTVTELRVTPRQDLLLHGIAAGRVGRGRAAPARPRRHARRRRQTRCAAWRSPARRCRPAARRSARPSGCCRTLVDRAREGARRRRHRRRADPAQHDRLPERLRPARTTPRSASSGGRKKSYDIYVGGSAYGRPAGRAHPQPTCRSTSSPRPWPRCSPATPSATGRRPATVATPARSATGPNGVGAGDDRRRWLPGSRSCGARAGDGRDVRRGRDDRRAGRCRSRRPRAADRARPRGSLAEADVVVHDALVGDGVLALAPPDAELIDVGKRPGRPVPQELISTLLVELGRRGRRGGAPQGWRPVRLRPRRRGGRWRSSTPVSPFEVVPGITSAVAAPAAAGIPVTHRGVSAAVHRRHRSPPRRGEPDVDGASTGGARPSRRHDRGADGRRPARRRSPPS